MTAMAMMVAGCESYRPEPLRPANELAVLNQRDVQSVTPEVRAVQESLALPAYHPEDGLDEAELVMVALAFNPDLRDRRYAAAQLGETKIGALIHFRPEMKVSVRSATVGFATDSEVLYTLLVPSARAAWHEADQARILQARAEMLAAESQLVGEVRRAHLAVRLAWQRQALIDQQVERRQHVAAALASRPPGKEEGLAAALVAWIWARPRPSAAPRPTPWPRRGASSTACSASPPTTSRCSMRCPGRCRRPRRHRSPMMRSTA